MPDRATPTFKPIRKSDRKALVGRLKADIPKTVGLIASAAEDAIDFDTQLADLKRAVVKLMQVPASTDVDAYAAELSSRPFEVAISKHLSDELGPNKFSVDGLAYLMLEGARSDVNAAIAWGNFKNAELASDPNDVRQWMAGGAYFFGRACAAQVDESVRKTQSDGGTGKQSKSPIRKAAACAIGLWPAAHRNGWTAERLRLELERQGHSLKPDTVRKWMTKLRTTGVC